MIPRLNIGKSPVAKKVAGLPLIAITSCLLALSGLSKAENSQDLPKEVTINGVEFVLIPEGEFYKTGGIPKPGVGFEVHHAVGQGNVKIWLDSYYIAKYEARARDLVSFLNKETPESGYDLGEKNCSVDRTWTGKYVEKSPGGNLPATHLSWSLTNEWAQWMGFRLPTEAEWEKAARGNDQRTYPWGDAYPDETYAGFGISSNCFTWPVDTFQKGRSPYGVFNMAGNVREYVADWYSMDADKELLATDKLPAATKKQDATTWINKSQKKTRGPWKMLKGGRWAANEEKIRIGARVYWDADLHFRCNGARFALDSKTVKQHLDQGTAVTTGS